MTRFRSFLLLLVALPTASSVFAGGPNVLKNAKHDTSAPLAQMVVGSANPKSAADKEANEPKVTGPALNSGKKDPVAAALAGALTGVTQVINFDGQSANDNRRVFGFAFV